MNKLKVITVLGTRPEIIRLSRIIPLLDEHFDHTLVYTNQNYDHELSTIFFNELGIREPDSILSVKSDFLGETVGNIIAQTEKIFDKVKPDALLILGDTNSALCSIIAKRKGILIFHMEAGNRSFDDSVPEEINRKIVDHTSDINLPYSENARRNLLHEGIPAGSIYVTGSPLTEVLGYYRQKISKSTILNDLKVAKNKYFLLSMHREENVDNVYRLNQLMNSLKAIIDTYHLPIVVSLHPRTRLKLQKEKLDKNLDKQILLCKPFGYFDYLKLQMESVCVLSDSGSVPEESAILGFKAIQIRVSTERQEAYDKGSILLSGFNSESIIRSIEITLQCETSGLVVDDYKDSNVSEKVVKIIHGLTSIKKHNKRIYY